MCSDAPLQIVPDVVVSVEFGESGESPGRTSAIALTTQTAVTHSSADGTLPGLQEHSHTQHRAS